MNLPLRILVTIAALSWLLPIKGEAKEPQPVRVGWVEYILVKPDNLKLKAKLDTGATTSSVAAHNVKEFSKGLENWVEFAIDDRNGHSVTLERKIERYVRIKSKEGSFVRRPMVRMGLCLGKIYVENEVNLANRDNFIYPILIGRNMLAYNVTVDASRSFMTKPDCTK